MPPILFDRFDSAALSFQIQRSLETGLEKLPSLADQIAPFEDVRDRSVKFRRVEVDAFGVGQLRAPDASPRLWRTTHRIREELIDLALPDEMEHISEDTLAKLDSSDPLVQMSGGVDLITRGQVLARRSARRVEKMRWDAFLKGYVDLDYEDSGERITFAVPNDHFVDVTGTGPWTTTSTDIVSQIRGWQKKVADDIGEYGTQIHMNSDTWELVFNNAPIRDLLSSWGRSLMVPTGTTEVASLLRGGTGDETTAPRTQIIVYDGGFRDVGTATGNLGLGMSQITKWIPYGKVLITTPYVLGTGERIADTPNGRVRVASGYNSATWVQSPQAETVLQADPPHDEFLRYARANIPRLLIPEAFFVATVAV